MRITGRTRLAGIMGWPIAHSRSPALHNFWLDEQGVDGVYVPMPVRPEQLAQALRALPALGFYGCNLTIPHKQMALSIVDRVDPLARRIGAINTVVVAADGALEGSNTDVYGFRESLHDAAPDWEPTVGAAVVLGAGGAARAVVAALIEAGVPEIRLVNRTVARAQQMAEELAHGPVRIAVKSWQSRASCLDGAGLLVNTTSLGMAGEPELEIDLSALPQSAIVVDIVYVPLETGLLAAAGRRGNRVIDGLGMLLHQGRPGFEAWFGVSVRVTRELRAAVLTTLAGGKVIILGLTGSIGMGKSTAATTLRRLGVPLFDADAEVHRVIGPRGAAVGRVEAAFPGVRHEAGGINRARLGRLVFGDPEALRRLEGILHPLVRQAEKRFVAQARARRERLVVLDIPLLFESGGVERCDFVLVVSAPRRLQRERVMRRVGMTESRFAEILRVQMPDHEKRRRAHFVVATALGRGVALRRLTAIVGALGQKRVSRHHRGRRRCARL